MKNKYKKLFSDVGLFAVSNFGSKLLVFLLVPLYTNVLSTFEYGIIDMITATINVLCPVLTLAISEAVLRFAFEKNYKHSEVLVISMYTIIFSLGIVLALKGVIISFLKPLEEYWGYFLTIYLETAISSCLSNYVRGIDKARVFAIKGVLYTALFVVLNIIFLVFLKLGLIGYLMSIIISELVTIIYMAVSAKLKLKYNDLHINTLLLKDMLRYSMPLIPTIVAWWVMQISDKYIIIYFSGVAASGVYGISYKIPTILSVFTSIFIQAWQISAIKSVDDTDNEQFVSSIYKYFMMFSIGVCSILILLSKWLGSLLYAKDYFIAWTYVPILLMAYLFSGVSGVLASLFSAKKKTNILFHSTTVGAVINIVLNFLLVPKFGAIAAAYTTFIGFLVTWLIRLISVKRIMNLESNGIKDIISLLLLFFEALIMSLDLSFKYVFSISIIFIYFVLYADNLKQLIEYLISSIKMKRIRE